MRIIAVILSVIQQINIVLLFIVLILLALVLIKMLRKKTH